MGTLVSRILRSRGFFRSETGNVAMLFALACLVIFPLVGFAIDFSRVIVEKQKLQQATDAAALAAAHDAFMTESERRQVVEAHLNHLEEDIGRDVDYDFSMDEDGRISLITRISVNTTIAKITGRDEVNVRVRSDALEGGSDIEVAMILDITGSMAGSRITALKSAAKDLVDIVVEDVQTPYYSKASMVPYSVAVNTGSYAATVRGPVTPGKSISDAQWKTGLPRLITGASKTNPVVINSLAHGFSNGDAIYITGVSGMTQLNNKMFTVKNASLNAFELSGVNGKSYSNYTLGGSIAKCITTSCEVQVKANGHGLANSDHVVISGVKGMTQINTGTNVTWQVSAVSTNYFVLDGSFGPNYTAYTNSGTSYCTVAGCQYFRFNNASNGAQRVHEISNCATERTGGYAYSDVAPSTAYVGRGYTSSANDCPSNEIVPLTSNKSTLKTAITNLATGGSTAGHLGAAWGFYTLSPNFGSIFPAASQPAMYGRPKLHKFAVFMTDGDFNSSFCKGVLSQTSSSGSGSTADQINCNSENGDSFTQQQKYCTAMKESGITVYTVGFEVPSQGLKDALKSCASSPQYAYLATGSAQLIDVFQQIGRSINEVRLVH